jgi:hypothetical protein
VKAIKQCFKSIFKNSMKTFFYSFAILFFSFCAKAQENNLFTVGFKKNSLSKILGEQRKVWIHIPNSHGGNENTGNEHYPVRHRSVLDLLRPWHHSRPGPNLFD